MPPPNPPPSSILLPAPCARGASAAHRHAPARRATPPCAIFHARTRSRRGVFAYGAFLRQCSQATKPSHIVREEKAHRNRIEHHATSEQAAPVPKLWPEITPANDARNEAVHMAEEQSTENAVKYNKRAAQRATPLAQHPKTFTQPACPQDREENNVRRCTARTVASSRDPLLSQLLILALMLSYCCYASAMMRLLLRCSNTRTSRQRDIDQRPPAADGGWQAIVHVGTGRCPGHGITTRRVRFGIDITPRHVA